MELSADYFELFGLPLSYEVDRDQLAQQYRELQQQYHPDRYASASDQERRLSLQMASRVNEGNRVLRDPVARARYLLEQMGVDLGTDSQTVRDPSRCGDALPSMENASHRSGRMIPMLPGLPYSRCSSSIVLLIRQRRWLTI